MASPTRLDDAAVLNISGKMLPSEIAKTIQGVAAMYAPASSSEGWYYKLTNVTTTSGLLLSESPYLSKGADARGTDVGSNTSIASLSDKVKFLIVIHTGFRADGSTNNDESIYISTNGASAAHNANCIEIGNKELWYAKMNNTTIGDINAIVGDPSGGGTGSNKVQCVVAAILEDV